MLETIVSAINEKQLHFTTKQFTIDKVTNLLTKAGWQPANTYHFNTKKVTIGTMATMLRAQGWR